MKNSFSKDIEAHHLATKVTDPSNNRSKIKAFVTYAFYTSCKFSGCVIYELNEHFNDRFRMTPLSQEFNIIYNFYIPSWNNKFSVD